MRDERAGEENELPGLKWRSLVLGLERHNVVPHNVRNKGVKVEF